MSLVGLLLAAPRLAVAEAPQGNPVAEARAAAADGRRGEALAMLESRLAVDPRDVDARFVYGLVLSWVGRYDDARRELERVLTLAPSYADARLALANVEHWSGRSDRLLELATAGLAQTPSDPAWRRHRARALFELGRVTEAEDATTLILREYPRDAAARGLRREIDAALRPWAVELVHTADSFSDARTGWQESAVSIGRAAGASRVLARLSTSKRFGLSDSQVEIEAYPTLGPGTSAYLNVGGSVDNTLYPHRRMGAELFQALGARVEASFGWRRLQFTGAPTATTIWTGSVTAYAGRWMLLGRAYAAPGASSDEATYVAQVRRYFGAEGRSFVGGSYSRGWREEVRNTGDLDTADSDTVRVETDVVMTRRLRLTVAGAVSRQDAVVEPLLQRTLRASLEIAF